MNNDIDLRSASKLVFIEGLLGLPLSLYWDNSYSMLFSLVCLVFSAFIFRHTGGLFNQVRTICPACKKLEIRPRRAYEKIDDVITECCTWCDDGLVRAAEDDTHWN